MEVAQYYTVFNYVPPRLQRDLNPQYRTIMAVSGMNPAQNFVLPGNSKDKVGKETPPDAFIMDNLETLLATIVDKSHGNTSGAIVNRLIKPRASKMFGNPVYFLDGTGLSIAVSGPHEEFSILILLYE